MAYNYTKPRRPVGACYNSPGPIYSLPSLVGSTNHDPRSVHRRHPAYVFGNRGKSAADSCTPGPYHFSESLVFPSAPRHVVSGRPKSCTVDGSSIPVAYRGIEADHAVATRPPAYSMAGRHPIREKNEGPGPAKYVGIYTAPVESKCHRAPSYPLVSRGKSGSFHEDLHKTPGPGSYNEVNQKHYLPRPPNYCIGTRLDNSADGSHQPGPATHFPERVKVNKTQAPKFSFGIRHSALAIPYVVMVN